MLYCLRLFESTGKRELRVLSEKLRERISGGPTDDRCLVDDVDDGDRLKKRDLGVTVSHSSPPRLCLALQRNDQYWRRVRSFNMFSSGSHVGLR